MKSPFEDVSVLPSPSQSTSPVPLPTSSPKPTAPVSATQVAINPSLLLQVMLRNKLKADPNAQGDHSVIHIHPDTGKIIHYETYQHQTNPRNPEPWKFVKRYDDTGVPNASHFNKSTKRNVPEPHVHDPTTPGGVRAPQPQEIPKSNQ